jgi:hypothetical protein
VSTELGVGDTVSTNPPAVEVLLADAEGATFLALVSPGVGTPALELRHETQLCTLRVA